MTKPITSIDTKFAEPFGKEKFTTLAIRIGHRKPGFNYFSGTHYPAGHTLSYTPCTITETPYGQTRSSVPMSADQFESGFFTFLNDSARKNPHYIARVIPKLTELAPQFAEAYGKRDGETLKALAAQVAAAGVK